jgi:hypothetical protein
LYNKFVFLLFKFQKKNHIFGRNELVQGKDGKWAVCFRNLLNVAESDIRLNFTKHGEVCSVRSSGLWVFVRFQFEHEAKAALDDATLVEVAGDYVKPARCTIASQKE